MATEHGQKSIHSLILDTGPLIKNAVSISTIINSAEEIITTPAILSEIRDEATRSRVQTQLVPFLKIRNPSPASYDAVIAFSKKTGDYSVLSRQDLGILALAYEVHCERNGGSWGLREAPKQPIKQRPGEEVKTDKKVEVSETTAPVEAVTTEEGPKSSETEPENVGEQALSFTKPRTRTRGKKNRNKGSVQSTATEGDRVNESTTPEQVAQPSEAQPVAESRLEETVPPAQPQSEVSVQPVSTSLEPTTQEQSLVAHDQSEITAEKAIADGTEQVPTDPTSKDSQTELANVPTQSIATEASSHNDESEQHTEQSSTEPISDQPDLAQDFSTLNISTPPSPPATDDSDSDGEWITPSNLSAQQAKDAGVQPSSAETHMDIATMTIDFAMQSVLLQMNLNLLSTNMQRIRHLKSKVLRCHACFFIERNLTKQFCPRCGGATLKRVSCSTDSSGGLQIHLAKNFQHNKRGDRYSVPKPIAGTANGKWSGQGGGQGGWGRDLILAEDQKEFLKVLETERRSKGARDLMDEDYLPGIVTGDRSGRAGGRVKVGAGKNVNSKKRA
ncbi:Nin one binding Zn-ribbon like-domain-containing protein [Paraphoma chrysanthemicola]|uniref:20S-pre-rRNA D-site endonuclease NOB1 n=1 Tax=Paraphoma chrysanthemicola TaxID=798071 RepID=A0A8K0R0Y9_9PLEO|nr:Nin one binding Zn-ribbon like-domain-containing protein [Paraphoma chrysanthemicola]